MTYTHLLFDLDGTLFDFDAGETYAFHKVCDTFHIPYSDEVLSLYQRINLSYWKAYERGSSRRRLSPPTSHTTGHAVPHPAVQLT